MDYIDDMVSDLEEREGRPAGEARKSEDIGTFEGQEESRTDALQQKKVLVGMVEHFYDKLNVAAIRLTGGVKIGDTLEIENDAEIVKLKVSSMQIDRKDVEEASDGDDVGIKTDIRVVVDSRVYVVD